MLRCLQKHLEDMTQHTEFGWQAGRRSRPHLLLQNFLFRGKNNPYPSLPHFWGTVVAVFTAPEVPFPRVIWVKGAEKRRVTQKPPALTFGGTELWLFCKWPQGLCYGHAELQESDRVKNGCHISRSCSLQPRAQGQDPAPCTTLHPANFQEWCKNSEILGNQACGNSQFWPKSSMEHALLPGT